MLFFKDCAFLKAHTPGRMPREEGIRSEWVLRTSQSQMMWGLVQVGCCGVHSELLAPEARN